jgi:hypothetical protein
MQKIYRFVLLVGRAACSEYPDIESRAKAFEIAAAAI